MHPPMTKEERNAVDTLRRLAKRWPRSLMLASMDGPLIVYRQADEDLVADWSTRDENSVDPDPERRIPNTGGGW